MNLMHIEFLCYFIKQSKNIKCKSNLYGIEDSIKKNKLYDASLRRNMWKKTKVEPMSINSIIKRRKCWQEGEHYDRVSL